MCVGWGSLLSNGLSLFCYFCLVVIDVVVLNLVSYGFFVFWGVVFVMFLKNDGLLIV